YIEHRARQIEWTDLIRLSRLDIVRELTLSPGSWGPSSSRITGSFPSPSPSRTSSSSPASVRFTTPITTRWASGAPRRSGDVRPQRPDAGLHARRPDHPPPAPSLPAGRRRRGGHERAPALVAGDPDRAPVSHSPSPQGHPVRDSPPADLDHR